MEAPSAKGLCFFVLFFLAATLAGLGKIEGAGECGQVPADRMAFRMAPCASASQDEHAQVSASCCSSVQKLGKTPRCLCAIMLSNTAKSAGIKPEIAITIPMRCNLADRPVGYKCGAYTLP